MDAHEKVRIARDELTERIAADVARHFRCMGEGANVPPSSRSPISEALKDQPLMFAHGVDVRAVVAHVLEYIRNA